MNLYEIIDATLKTLAVLSIAWVVYQIILKVRS
jgi:hypothetical protein